MDKSILEKLKKLIKHERSAREIGSIAEAEVFAEKIQEFCDAYNLSVSEIDVDEIKSTIGSEAVDLKLTHRWQEVFAMNLAEIHGCVLVRTRTGTIVIGNEIDRLILIEIWEYFQDLGQAFADRYIREYQATAAYRRKRRKHLHSRRERESFCLGFVIAIVRRFRERHDAAIAASQNSTALIFIGNKLAEADAWKDKNLQTRTSTRPKLKLSNLRDDAFERGIEAGDSVALTTKTVS